MHVSALKTHWMTVTVCCLVAILVLAASLFVGVTTVRDLTDAQLSNRAHRFAQALSGPTGEIDAFLTGISRRPDTERRMKLVAKMAGISAFTIFDRNGQETFRTRSDRYEWLIRDRPGGMNSGDRLTKGVLDRQGDWSIVHAGDAGGRVGIAPLRRDGATVGYVAVDADLGNTASDFSASIRSALAAVLLMFALATGLPLLFHLRRKRRMAEAAQKIDFLANHDNLTGVLNRGRMQHETDRCLALARATRERMAYLYIDLDDLADTNAVLGQAAGDQLLKAVADRLSAATSDDHLLARIGPDDFAILHRRMASIEEVVSLAKQITLAVSEPVEIDGTAIAPKISIGCALVPDHGRTHSELVKHAEVAHYHQKSSKTDVLTIFDPSMDEATHRRREIEACIRKALETNGFELHFQPIVDGAGAHLLGFEALVRLRDNNGEEISPAVFVPIAEARGYIKAIGTWVIRQAAWQAAQWPDELFVSVNLSAVQFGDGDLVDIVRDAIETAQLDGRRLELEVVESLILERSETILHQLQALKELGVGLDMDDFGTGYSSLGYLWRFPFDKLKIDRSFMVALQRGEPKVPQILETIVSMAHHLGMKVTTEGAETAEQVALLQKIGSDQIQGFYFGRPVPAEQAAAEVIARFRHHTNPKPCPNAPKVVASESNLLAG